ncbi:MAG: carboxypeptidase regulatory-like domain-containing protein, partial [Planctomycetes bacterium]|nr:carboxypeptidase regulatory-like domain-containing protein [Planctomycetota bacterium]
MARLLFALGVVVVLSIVLSWSSRGDTIEPIDVTDTPDPLPLEDSTIERLERIDTAAPNDKPRFVDELGHGVEGLEVRFQHVFRPKRILSGRTGLGGVVDWVGTATPGPYGVTLKGGSFRLQDPDMVLDLPDDDAVVAVVALPDRPRIVGRVRSDSGFPIRGAWIQFDCGAGRGGSVTTDEHGWFEFDALSQQPSSAVLHVEATGFAGVVLTDVTFGGESLDLELEPTTNVLVHVVESATENSVERFGIRTRPITSVSPDVDRLRLRGSHETGRVVVDDLWPGTDNLILVVPEDPSYERPEVCRIDPSVTSELRVELRRRATAVVRVVDPTDAPCEGLLVQLIDTRSDRIGTLLDPSERRLGLRSGFLRHAPFVVSSGATNSDGLVTVGIPAEPRRLLFRVRRERDDTPDQLLLDEFLPSPPPSEWLVRVPVRVDTNAKGRMTGTVRHAFPPSWDLRVSVGDQQVHVQDGSFVIPEVRAGQHPVNLTVAPPAESGRLRDFSTQRLGSVSVPGGGDVHGEYVAFSLGRIQGTVTISGRPAHGVLSVLRDPSLELVAECALDEQGRFASEPLWPDSLVLRLEASNGRDRPWWDPDGPRRLSSDSSLDVVLDLRPRKAVFDVRDEDGFPVRDTRLLATIGPSAEFVTTDAYGRAEVERLPHQGELRLWRSWRQHDELASVRLTRERS